MKAVFIFAVLLAGCFRGEGQLLLNPGDQRSYQFDALPRTGSTNAFLATSGGWFEFTVDADAARRVYRLREP